MKERLQAIVLACFITASIGVLGIANAQNIDPYQPEQKSLTNYDGWYYIIRALESRIPPENKKDVVLIIMDSGVNGSHEDFCPGQIDRALSKTFLDSRHDTSSPLIDPHGHGSMVAGIADACSSNGIGIASWGMGDVPLASLKVMFPIGGGTIANYSDVEKALTYLKQTAIEQTNRKFVVNMSFAFSLNNEKFADLVASMPPNVHLFAGAGNNPNFIPEDKAYYPAAFPEVVSVTASSDENPNALCNFSYFQESKSIAAAGCSDIWGFSNTNDGSFPYKDGGAGTSYATPALAGAVAKLMQLGFSFEDIMRAVNETAFKIAIDTNGNPTPPLHGFNALATIQKLAVDAGYPDLVAPPTPTPEYNLYLPSLQH